MEWVYFVRFGPLVKIGITTDLQRRFNGMCGQSPVPLEMYAAVPGYRTEELALHEHFSARRRHGEWFEINDELQALMDDARRSYGVPEVPMMIPSHYLRFLQIDDAAAMEDWQTDLQRQRELRSLQSAVLSASRDGDVPPFLLRRLWRTMAILGHKPPYDQSLLKLRQNAA